MFTHTSITSIGGGKSDGHKALLPSLKGDNQKDGKDLRQTTWHTEWFSQPNPAIIDSKENLPVSFPFKGENISTQRMRQPEQSPRREAFAGGLKSKIFTLKTAPRRRRQQTGISIHALPEGVLRQRNVHLSREKKDAG